MRVLLAEDNVAIASALNQSLAECGYLIDWVADGIAADTALCGDHYDLLVLDLGLPRIDGMAVLDQARRRKLDLAVLVVTACDGISERVHALDHGADDFLVKPFALVEFVARCRALLRRRRSGGIPETSFGRLRINLDARRLYLGDETVELTAREYALFEALYARQQRVVSRNQLVEAVCDWEQDITDNGLDISIHRLRRKLLDSGVQIRTIRGLGYLLEEATALAADSTA
ncbi:MAG: response regulator transcription factor [Luteimonas sp.]